MTNSILIPTDFSDVCNNAIEHGAGIAKYLNSKLYILHVVNRSTKRYLRKNNLSLDDIDDMLEKKQAEIELKYSIPVEPIMHEGSIFHTIAEVAEEKGAAMMVLGTHGLHGIQNLTGSHAMRVVNSSPIPDIVVQQRSFGDGYREIVVPVHNPVDFDLKSKWVAYFSRLFSAHVNLFQIKETDPMLNKDVINMTDIIINELDKETVSYEVDKAEEEGDYAEQLIEFAVKKKSDLIMIMTNALEDHPEFILGPWEESLIYNEAQIPVMCLNPTPVVIK